MGWYDKQLKEANEHLEQIIDTAKYLLKCVDTKDEIHLKAIVELSEKTIRIVKGTDDYLTYRSSEGLL